MVFQIVMKAIMADLLKEDSTPVLLTGMRIPKGVFGNQRFSSSICNT